jgi:hypothetical protein
VQGVFHVGTHTNEMRGTKFNAETEPAAADPVIRIVKLPGPHATTCRTTSP